MRTGLPFVIVLQAQHQVQPSYLVLYARGFDGTAAHMYWQQGLHMNRILNDALAGWLHEVETPTPHIIPHEISNRTTPYPQLALILAERESDPDRIAKQIVQCYRGYQHDALCP